MLAGLCLFMKKTTNKPTRPLIVLTSKDLAVVSGGETIEICVGITRTRR